MYIYYMYVYVFLKEYIHLYSMYEIDRFVQFLLTLWVGKPS